MASTPMLESAVPDLPSRNFDATKAFYGGFGLEPVFRDVGWMILT
ncbi:MULTISPECIES: hypothetical protein [unclassified Cryobacterium]|nr:MULTISPECIES: hypothetical protein [unclassified Cryobacterium]